jgi:methylase of polypeptide subunit release factors
VVAPSPPSSVTTFVPPAFERREDIAALRRLIAAAGYTGPAIQERTGTEQQLLARPADFPAHLKRLEGDASSLATLIRLFVLLASVGEDDVDRALAPLGTAGLEGLGLVARAPERRLVAAMRLIPHDDLVIASDLPHTGSDHVPGVQRPSFALANLTVRRPVARALDVGTGSGIQALLAARHAEHVVATDISERALAFAAFNYALNGVDNVELRRGSFLEPVAGEQFDLVVANPPYVISPETSLVFRDSGLGGDRVSADLVRALPSVLAEGGFATVMVSWIQPGDDPAAAPRSWLAGSGCDAWILHTRTDDPLRAAAAWNRDAPSAAEYTERIERWLDYFRQEGIEAIAYGGIVMRRRSGPNWVRSTQLPHRTLHQAGPQLEQLFAAQDFLAEVPTDEALLERRFAVAAGTTLEQTLAPSGGRWSLQESELRLGGGLDFVAGLDEYAMRIVTALDPTRPLGETLDATAATVDLDHEEFRAAGATLVRRMVELGFLVPAE